jgi:hypothetical protein
VDKIAEALGIEPFDDFVFDIESLDKRFDSKFQSEEAIKRNKEIVQCTRCGIFGNRPNMMRWHFEACKTKLKECEECHNIIPRQNVKDSLYDKKKFCNSTCYFKSKLNIPPVIMTDDVKKKISESALKQSKERSDRAKKNQIWKKSGRWNKELK